MKMTEDWHQFSKEESIIQQTTKAASGYDKNKTTDIFKDRRLEDSYSLYKKHLKHSEERIEKIHTHTCMKNSPKQKLVLSSTLCSKSLDFQIIVAPPDCKEIICNSNSQSINQGIL